MRIFWCASVQNGVFQFLNCSYCAMYITHTTLVPYSTANGDVYTLGEVIVPCVGISISFQFNSINQVFKSEIIIILLMMIFFGNIADHQYSLQCRNVFLHIHLQKGSIKYKIKLYEEIWYKISNYMILTDIILFILSSLSGKYWF